MSNTRRKKMIIMNTLSVKEIIPISEESFTTLVESFPYETSTVKYHNESNLGVLDRFHFLKIDSHNNSVNAIHAVVVRKISLREKLAILHNSFPMKSTVLALLLIILFPLGIIFGLGYIALLLFSFFILFISNIALISTTKPHAHITTLYQLIKVKEVRISKAISHRWDYALNKEILDTFSQ